MGYRHTGARVVEEDLEVREGVENRVIYGTDMSLVNKLSGSCGSKQDTTRKQYLNT